MKRHAILAALSITATLFFTTSALNAATPKRILLIQNNTASVQSDIVLVNALNSTGVTADGTAVPGLGYQVTAIQHGEELDTYTTETDLIFVSESVTSITPKNHMDDAVPMVVTENAFVPDDASRPNAMFFCDTNNSGQTLQALTLTNNTHPITEIFPLGPLTTHTAAADLSTTSVNEPLGAGITSLANTGVATLHVLLLIDQGGTGLLNPPAGAHYVTMPAKRAYIGVQNLQNATANGIYLLQRTVQWAIGDPVNAGGVPAAGVSQWSQWQ